VTDETNHRGDGPPDATEASPRRKGSQRSFLFELPVILVVALILSLLIKTFLMQAFFIPSASMEQTLMIGDRVFVNKLATHFGEIERGDVVVFKDPGNWLDEGETTESGNAVQRGLHDALVFVGLAPSAEGDDLIKRVIGVGGDRVVCCDADGRMTVNGVPLEETYLFPGDVPSEIDFNVTVPKGSIWVMGDHRSVSADSRFHQEEPGHGFVPLDNVIGRAFVVVWPLDRAKGLGRPDTFARIESP
jgi:signal peptidase I